MSDRFIPSGDPEIDNARQRVREYKTIQEIDELLGLLYCWLWLLARLRYDIAVFEPVQEEIAKRLMQLGYQRSGHSLHEQDQVDNSADHSNLISIIEKGYEVLDQLQNSRQPSVPSEDRFGPTIPYQPGEGWQNFKKDHQQTGNTADIGPTEGKIDWRFATGIAWYSRPLVEDGRIYLASPGMRNKLICVDAITGDVIWKTRQSTTGQIYSTPAVISSPIAIKNEIIVRESNYQTNYIVFIDKATGEINRKTPISNTDYRAGYAPLVGNDEILLSLEGEHRLSNFGAGETQLRNFESLVCRNIQGDVQWTFHCGESHVEPLIADSIIIIATAKSGVYGLSRDDGSIQWHCFTGSAVNQTPEIFGGRAYFGANDGFFYCVDAKSGYVIWYNKVADANSSCHKLFSTPAANENIVVVGDANGYVYILDADNGAEKARYEVGEWVRARPIIANSQILIATLDGRVISFDYIDDEEQLNRSWETRVSQFEILADLTVANDNLYVNSSNLYTTCLDTRDGTICWRRSVLDHATVEGQEILADMLAAGSWYQSSPVIVDGTVFIGSPARFVYAIDAKTGRKRWRFETAGGAVSGAPVYYDGALFFGQQGGSNLFYRVNAKTGQCQWEQHVGWTWMTVNVADDEVYLGTVNGWIWCLDVATGNVSWKRRTGGGVHPAPPIWNESIMFGSWDQHYYLLERKSGDIIWRSNAHGSPDSGAPAVADGFAFMPVGGERFVCMDIESGKSVWDYQYTGRSFNATPALTSTRVLVSTHSWYRHNDQDVWLNSQIISFDRSTGKRQWDTPGGGLTGPVVASNRAYFGSSSSVDFTCVSVEDGKVIWSVQMDDRIEEGCPAIDGNRAFILSADGYLYSFG